jgi:hypothetical protein
MDTPTQDVPGYYVWEAPGAGAVVHISLDLIDRLSADVMRGFGAVRKRGAEIGGLLVGSVEEGAPTLVRVTDYVTVPCEYRRGPSYLFTEEDSPAFEEAFNRVQPIGYFRSHTRDGFELESDDVDLLDHFFTNPSSVALLIRPDLRNNSVAGIFLRENGQFQRTTLHEFPFHRRTMAPADSGQSLQSNGRDANLANIPFDSNVPSNALDRDDQHRLSQSHSPGDPSPSGSSAVAKSLRPRRMSGGPAGWVWFPLSFVFLVLGGLLGFEVARSTASRPVGTPAEGYSLGFRAVQSEANVGVHWDGQAPVVQAASKGQLEIEDGEIKKVVDLDTAQLRNGTLLYKNTSETVQLRLTVFPRSQVAVTESLEWKQGSTR